MNRSTAIDAVFCPRLSLLPITSDPRFRFALHLFAVAEAASAGNCGADFPKSAWLPPPSDALRPYITQRSTRPVAGLQLFRFCPLQKRGSRLAFSPTRVPSDRSLSLAWKVKPPAAT